MNRHSPSAVAAYVVAVAVVAAALLIRLAINPWLGPTVPYLQFFPAILIASWYGGFGPGVVAALLSTLTAYVWFLPPFGIFKWLALIDVTSLVLFVLIGVGIAYLSGSMKQAEAVQRQAADQWRTTLASIGDAVIVTDATGRVTFLNGVAERLTGWDMASAINRSLDEVFVIANEETHQPAESPVARVLRDGVVVTLANHTVLQRRDGMSFPIADSGAPIRGGTDRVEGVVLVFRDMTAERQADLALRRSQGLLDAIADNSEAVIYAKDLEGRYLLVNRRFCELFHVTADGMAGKTDYDLFSKDAADAFRGMDQRVAAAGVALTEEEFAPQDDGVHTYISVKCPLRDNTSRTYAVFGISTDITDRKRTEEALRANEERTRLIIETALDAVVTMDTSGAITGWSPQAERTFGWTRQEVLGRSMADTIVPERYRESHRQGLRRFLATGEGVVLNQRLELSALRRDGTEIPIELSITPVRTADGLSFSAFVRDITERKQSEQRLHAQVERLNLLDRLTRAIGERQDLESILQVVVRSLEDNLPIDFCAICLYDRADESLRVTRVGAKSQPLAVELAMSERARIQIDQNGLSRCVQGQLVYEPDIGAVAAPFPQRLARGGLRSFVASPLVVESQVFGVLIAARQEANGFSSSECEFLRQLSEHVALAVHQAQLYSALQQAYDDLRQTQQAVMQQERLKALGQMASGIAHDINNAISPIALYTESLLETERHLSGQAREYLSTIQRAIDDVAQTVSRMQEFYRQREPQLVLAPVDVNQIVQEVTHLTRARWSDMPQQRGIVLTMVAELAPDAPVIMGLESEIREALINLIFNAVDAMPEGGTLTLRTRVTDGSGRADTPSPRRLEIEVGDTGAGMDPDTRRRCLEPFFTTKGERGTGLGLAMVYGIVQRHSAEIEIESAPGKGTTVRLSFTVPLATATVPVRSREHQRAGRLRILVIDDDPLLLRSLRDTLEADGHAVTASNGGQAGIDTFRTAHQGAERFSVVITDLGMPYVDGRQVASSIKETAPATPVILLTGWGQRLVEEEALPSHVDRVLSKPPKLSELRQALSELTAVRPS